MVNNFFKISGILVLLFVSIGSILAIPRYLLDINAANKRLSNLGGRVIETGCGPIEYSREGTGYPVLVVHGAMGGFDQGLLLAEGGLREGYEAIAVSRFGYLGSPRPENATMSMQADAYACLLDELGIEKAAVFATSAGATSAIRFAARHPERISALVLLSPAAPGSAAVENPPLAVFDTVMRSEFVYWSMVTYFKPLMTRMIGVPADLSLTPEMEVEVTNTLNRTLPVGGRIDGMLSDFTLSPSEFLEETSDTAIYPLKYIQTPVLVINALDDPLAVPENVRGLADKFPDARLVVYPDGGHLVLGHGEDVRIEIGNFLKVNARERISR